MPAYRRERWDTPDGDFVDVDFLPAAPGRPFLALFHGLEGSSGSHYARALMGAARARGWGGAVPHFRGCGGEANRLARAYHSGDTAEVAWMLERLAGLAGAPVRAAGVSLGGNALLKWLGEAGDAARDRVARAAAVSAPLDLRAAGAALERGFSRVYGHHFLITLRPKALAKARRHGLVLDTAGLARAASLRVFDDLYTAPVHGYAGVDDYWTRASSGPHLSGIRVPTLLLNARNDPFLPAAALPAPASLPATVVADFPAQGGHAGFVSGTFPGNFDWFCRRVLDFLASA